MKQLTNTYLLVSAFSAALICSSVYAAPKSHSDVKQQMLANGKLMSYTMANSNLIVSYNTTANSSFFIRSRINSLTQASPLELKREQSKEVVNSSCNTRKKNELYELSAIFNDKLQLFLSYFDERPLYSAVKKHKNFSSVAPKNNVSY